MSKLTYNERSWAIDLVTSINLYTKTVQRSIARAGGELTLKKTGENSLFPDVILYGDEAASRVRHGWELKLPDTPINDTELINNAKKKAIRFGVNSFLLWNVNEAVLYAAENGTEFSEFHRWPPLGIGSREEVKAKEAAWQTLLKTILNDLNTFFESGKLRSASVADILDENFFASVIEAFSGLAADNIKAVSRKKASVAAAIAKWWVNNAAEYGQKPNQRVDYQLLAAIVLTNWLNRFLFAHYLKGFNSHARAVEAIKPGMTIAGALEAFETITGQCNFLQVFRPEIATEFVGEETWEALCEVNMFLTGLQLDEVPQEILHEVIEQTLTASKRKAAGQYATPTKLAELLVALAIEDREGSVIDPCCGTGTIARAAYDLKRTVGLSITDALSTLWASDKYQFPLQLCTLSLADPEAMGKVTRIFKDDVFDLEEGKEITFIDPNDGRKIVDHLPVFDTIVSNLPFVRFEDLMKSNPDIKAVIARNEDFDISGKSDLIAIVIMHLRHLLNENGRLGVIIPNSWLGSDWGDAFKAAINNDFQIKFVVTSGAGRWFENADVVTNILVLEKAVTTDESVTTFVTTLTAIQDWTHETVDEIWRNSLTIDGLSEDENARYVPYKQREISSIGTIVAGWSLLFSDVHWITELRQLLIPITNSFKVYRGERRGWNPLFYPAAGHGIEATYIRPILKSARNVRTYKAAGTKEAFCCSSTKEELKAAGHSGALTWIARFEGETNGSGKPLPEALKQANHLWYEMKADKLADLVLSMNPAARIFIAKMPVKGFVDQRLIPFTAVNDAVDIKLHHALLNSLLGLLMIEAAGFGRGLGALDLSATKIRNGLLVLDPERLNHEETAKIIDLFAAFQEEEVLPLDQEIIKAKRVVFDKAVLSAYGILDFEDRIRSTLLQIYTIRTAVHIKQ